ncbi:MAG: HD domain-containing phosphohydrolase [Solirubrobacteraceae bacterium]
MPRKDVSSRDILVAVGALVMLGTLVYLLVRALTGYDLADAATTPGTDVIIRDRATLLPWVIGALLGGLAVLVGWWLTRAAAAGRAGAEERARALEAERDRIAQERDQASQQRDQVVQERDAVAQEREQVTRERDEARQSAEQASQEAQDARRSGEAEVRKERDLRGRVQRARQAEREWNRELRVQVLQMHRERGALGSHDDIRDLVLRVALDLLGAEKGLLLSRKDSDGDGNLDMVSVYGFDADPSNSHLAQHFAEEVIERDHTVRHDSWASREDATAADREIDNLVAIPIYMRDRFSGAVVCANKDGGFDEDEDEVLLSLGDHAGAMLENSMLHGELRRAYLATVRLLADAIEVKDPFLRGHSEEVSRYVLGVAEELGLDQKRREELLFGSLLHDVGKIGISERILLKPGALTAEERTVINTHPRIGYRLVEQVPSLQPISRGVLHHHERWDGDGYPSGLAGEQIPIEARIIAVVDTFSAMISDRPYRKALPVEDACAELERCAGTQFDPEVVRAFVGEVCRDPPSEGAPALAAALLSDPEVEALLSEGEPLLGYGAFTLVDNLTLLASRRHFHELAHAEAQRAAVQQRPFGVVVAELEGIEAINLRDGYAAGDTAIQSAAQVFQRIAGRTGTAARHGGCRLALLCPGADLPATQLAAVELTSALEGPLGARVGSAAWQPGDEGEHVVARAREGLRTTPGGAVRAG